MDWIFVIVRAIPLYTTFYIVSIHLMLLFIGFYYGEPEFEYTFQYISCYSLSGILSGGTYGRLFVSIHLMLLFIDIINAIYLMTGKFQYISCYSLSMDLEQFYGLQGGFNTSHVTLYLDLLVL